MDCGQSVESLQQRQRLRKSDRCHCKVGARLRDLQKVTAHADAHTGWADQVGRVLICAIPPAAHLKLPCGLPGRQPAGPAATLAGRTECARAALLPHRAAMTFPRLSDAACWPRICPRCLRLWRDALGHGQAVRHPPLCSCMACHPRLRHDDREQHLSAVVAEQLKPKPCQPPSAVPCDTRFGTL